MTKLTEDQVGEMAELREAGWSYGRLAARYGISATAIHYRCLVAGALSPRSQPIVPGDRRRPAVGFGRRQCRPFTPDEDARILELRRAGLPFQEIARRVGRPYTSTRIRLLTLELKADLGAAA